MGIAILTLLLVVPQTPRGAAEAETALLVHQLGSDSFQEREAATSALRSLGVKALPAVRIAKNDPDPEIRRRVARLLPSLEAQARSREIEAIKTSKLSPLEKGRKLTAFISKGMSLRQVRGYIGNGNDAIHGPSYGLTLMDSTYKELGLKLLYTFEYDRGVRAFRVTEILLIDKD